MNSEDKAAIEELEHSLYALPPVYRGTVNRVIAIAKRAVEDESWPKYYRGNKWSECDAYIRFDDATNEGVFVGADGSETVHKGHTFSTVPDAIANFGWRELTNTEALARVRPVAEPRYQSDVTCSIAASQRERDSVEVESPDDWVTQVVPVRETDEVQWSGNSTWSAAGARFVKIWHGKARHGMIDSDDGRTLYVRCRRKDLPKPEPTVELTPVRLFVDRNVAQWQAAFPVVCRRDCAGTQFAEIKPDGNGGWWQNHIEPFRDRAMSPLTTEFLRGRLRFLKPGQTEIGPNERPPFGIVLCIWERKSP